MNKTCNILQIGFISGIIGFISEYFGALKFSYVILLVLIFLDTLTGVAKALKYRRFSCYGLRKFTKKIITYSISILTARLMELGINNLFETSLLSQILAAYLVITESVSILENLALLGVPIPADFIQILLGKIRIPGINKMIGRAGRDEQVHIDEIDEIIMYQIPTFENEHIKRMLEIKFEVFKQTVLQIIKIFKSGDTDDRDLLYYKIMTVMQAAIQEIRDKWKDEVPSKYIHLFNDEHQVKVDECFRKIKTILASGGKIKTRKEQLLDCIKVLMYQTIMDARKRN